MLHGYLSTYKLERKTGSTIMVMMTALQRLDDARLFSMTILTPTSFREGKRKEKGRRGKGKEGR